MIAAKAVLASSPSSRSGVGPMHIPDGFLSTPVALVLWLVALVAVAYALRRVNSDLDERKVPLMGVMAATIFAGQMLNFSVTGGTSGHLMGAALAVIVLGPWAAILVMTCVVGTQALLFQDGGLLALGANIVNMGVVGVAVAYAAYWAFRRLTAGKTWSVMVGGFLAGWFSILIAALFAALQLAASGTSPANLAVPAMGGIHLLIGIGEGLITAGALALLLAARRDLLVGGQAQMASSKGLLAGGLLVAIVLALFSPYASAHPDGLEWVAEQRGFLDAAQDAPFSVIPDYVFPGVADERVATIVAGIVGLLIVFVVMLVVTASRRKRDSTRTI